MMKFVIATKNKHKVIEFKRILEPLGIEAVSQEEAGISADVIEDGNSFSENAEKKARTISCAGDCIAVADDSGICIDAFDGGPGIYSSRFLGEDTPYVEKNAIILDRLKDVKEKDRGARYVCAICCVFPNGDVITANGVFEGRIGYEAKGINGFGYDPIFYVGDKSISEISEEEKDKISHRGKALSEFVQKLNDYITKQGETNVNK